MTTRRRRRPERRALRRWLRPLLWTTAVLAVLAFLSVSVFPTRTWLDQRRALAETATDLDELDAEQQALQRRIEALDTDEEIELIARSQFGLVLPGEEAYSVLPPPQAPIDMPTIWPFGDADDPASVASAGPVAAPEAPSGGAPVDAGTASAGPSDVQP